MSRKTVAIVTGAAGGPGVAIARRLAAHGALLVLADLSGEQAALAEEFGERAVTVRADVSSEAYVRAVVDMVANTFGRLDFLCNNAGIDGELELLAGPNLMHLGLRSSSIESMLKTLALVGVLPLMSLLAVPAHADPSDVIDPGANYNVFLQAIEQDGIVMDGNQAIREGIAVCELIHPPNDGSLWDAGQHVLSIHPDWKVSSALDFSNRAIQDICPHRGSF